MIENRVAKSPLTTLSLDEFYPQGERVELDIAPWLYERVMLREKDFREHVKNHDWSQYEGKYVAVYCSEDAIIPQWAYMLLAVNLKPHAKYFVYGSRETLELLLIEKELDKLNVEEYRDKPIIIKGCGDLPIPSHAYLKIAARLQPVVKSLMFGEACSTVPVYKKPREKKGGGRE